MFRVAVLAVSAALLAAAPAGAQFYGKAPLPGDTGPPAPDEVGYDQRLGAKVPLDLVLYDHNAKPLTLGDAIGRKPTVLVMAYYRCPRLCNQVLTGLLDSLKDLAKADPAFVAGGPFNVVTVSVDPKEDPHALAGPRRTAFLQEYAGRADDNPGVKFLSPSHGQGTDVAAADRAVHRLADAVGFRYVLRQRGRDYFYQGDAGTWLTKDGRQLSERAREYDYRHASGVVFLAPDGTVTRYLMGIDYKPADVRSAVVDASGGKVGTLADKLLLYCLAYDDVRGHYKPTMRALGALALPVMLAVAFLAYRTVRRGLAEAPLKPGDPVPQPAPEPARG